MSPVPKSRVIVAACALLALPLAACVDTASQVRVDPTQAPANIARREGVSPRGAKVALADVGGAPQAVLDGFAAAFGQTAGAHELATAEPAKADYLVRGYLTAYAAEPGITRISYVFDLFDKRKQRIQRISDNVGIKGAAADPWSLADDQAVHALADRSAADLADALTNTPEAVVASAARPGASSATSTATSPASGQTTVPQGGTTAVARTETEPSPRLGLAATR